MINPARKSFVINYAFRNFFVASILASIITQCNVLVNGLIVSNVVSVDAISVVNLSMPILLLVMLVPSMIYFGASVIVAGEIGNQNYKQANRLFTMCISSVFIINIILVGALCVYSNTISNLLTSDERLLPLLKDYLPISLVGSFISAMQLSIAQFVKIGGRPGLVTKCMITSFVGNIVLNLLFVALLDMGMQGAALASALSSLLSMLVFIPYLCSEHKPFRLVSIRGGWYAALFLDSIKRGLPKAVEFAMIGVVFLCLNAIVMKSQGADGMFILSVCIQVLVVSLFVVGGAASAIAGIGGVLWGEQDYEGAHLLVNKVFKIVFVSMMAFSALIAAFPSVLAGLFGASGELLLVSAEPLRVFGFVLIPIGLVMLLGELFMILNRTALATIMSIGVVVCMLPITWLSSIFAPEYLWYSIPAAMWLLLIIAAVMTWLISRRTKGLHWLYLTQTSSHSHWVSYSVDYDVDDVETKLNELLRFIERYELPKKLQLNIHHCLEELMYNEVEMARYTKKSGIFDVVVNNHGDKVSVIIKDVGKPYNPMVKYVEISARIEDINPSQLSMLLVNGLCENINYKYMNGVNCIYLNFEKKHY